MLFGLVFVGVSFSYICGCEFVWVCLCVGACLCVCVGVCLRECVFVCLYLYISASLCASVYVVVLAFRHSV